MKSGDLTSVAVTLGLVAVIAGTATAHEAHEHATTDDSSLRVGPRVGVFLGDGEPANDSFLIGAAGRYRLADLWYVGLSVDYVTGDFEGPAGILGIETPEAEGVIDSTVEQWQIGAFVEREFVPTPAALRNLRPFGLVGVRFGITSADDLTGPTSDGGQFDIETDPGLEIIPTWTLGARYLLPWNLDIEAGLTADYHLADWRLSDRVSGARGSIDEYFALGGYLGLSARF